MLGYISSTRKKSCQACVKSKRRCDLGYPVCKRCFAKGLNCAYPNASVREAEVVVRQTTPDLLPLADVTGSASSAPVTVAEDPANLDPTFLQSSSSDSSSSPETIVPDELWHSLLESLLPQIWEPRILSEPQVSLIVHELCTFVPSIAYSGRTLFMHESLYQNFQPATFQDSCSLAGLYMVKTSKNLPIIANSIASKVSSLVASSSSWTLSEHLAAVQALIIYQIIRLFDPDLNQQALAERQNHLLELWTATLWKRSFNEPDAFQPNCYESWVFQESLRRTVLMSVFLRGAWCAVTNGGLCNQIPILARLPLTRDVRLFDCNAEEWTKKTPCQNPSGSLIAYGDLSVSWNPDRSVDELAPFERLLLAACRGDDDPRLLF